MPIYEYYCKDCNRIFNFLVKSLSNQKFPDCPKCGAKELKKKLSKFAVTGCHRKSKSDDSESTMDDPRVEREMMKLMNQAESIDENDPKQLGNLMRRMSDVTGEPLDGEMEEAVRRLEAGEDPEKIEEEMGDILGEDGPGGGMGGAPTYDDGLYEM